MGRKGTAGKGREGDPARIGKALKKKPIVIQGFRRE